MINIFQYLEKTKGKQMPLKIKLINNILLTKNDLTYNGDLNLFKSKINHLPNNLTVNGNLCLFGTNIRTLPNNLTVKGFINIIGTNISELPEDLYVANDLYCITTPLAYNIKNDKSLLKKYKQQVKGKIHYG